MIAQTGEIYSLLCVGKFRLCRINDKLYIAKDNSKSGEFSLKKFEKIVRKFFYKESEILERRKEDGKF